MSVLWWNSCDVHSRKVSGLVIHKEIMVLEQEAVVSLSRLNVKIILTAWVSVSVLFKSCQ